MRASAPDPIVAASAMNISVLVARSVMVPAVVTNVKVLSLPRSETTTN